MRRLCRCAKNWSLALMFFILLFDAPIKVLLFPVFITLLFQSIEDLLDYSEGKL